MPNGKPGDHPLTDILHHGSSSFGEPVDDLVKQMATLPNFAKFREEVANILWDHWPTWGSGRKGSVEDAYRKLLDVDAKLLADRQ